MRPNPKEHVGTIVVAVASIAAALLQLKVQEKERQLKEKEVQLKEKEHQAQLKEKDQLKEDQLKEKEHQDQLKEKEHQAQLKEKEKEHQLQLLKIKWRAEKCYLQANFAEVTQRFLYEKFLDRFWQMLRSSPILSDVKTNIRKDVCATCGLRVLLLRAF